MRIGWTSFELMRAIDRSNVGVLRDTFHRALSMKLLFRQLSTLELTSERLLFEAVDEQQGRTSPSFALNRTQRELLKRGFGSASPPRRDRTSSIGGGIDDMRAAINIQTSLYYFILLLFDAIRGVGERSA